MRFLRHLTAVVLVVAAIVGLGLLWAHASGGGSGFTQAPSPQAVERIGQIRSGAIRVQSDDGSNLGNLIRTCEIEAVLAAVVVTVTGVRRRRRRTRRTVEVLT